MDNRQYFIKISPENVNTIFKVNYQDGFITGETIDDECCDIVTTTTTLPNTGSTFVYSAMTQILSGGTNGSSLLTGLTIPILLTETTTDLGYYSVFDGAVTQKEVLSNFLFSANTSFPYTFYFYNTSDTEFKKYLEFSTYSVDWGDGSPSQTITTHSPNYQSHVYTQLGTYTITLSGASPFGYNIVKKTITVPFTNVITPNPNGEAFFQFRSGNWSGTPISYKFIYHQDENCSSQTTTTIPYIISGYTESTINDLQVYGRKEDLYGGKFKLGIQVTGTTGVFGTVYGESNDGLYTAYTINNIDYYDYSDGTTIFITETTPLTTNDLICSAVTKNEVLLNVIEDTEIQSNVFVERGKLSALERIERLGEVDNIGDLEKYGYKFFNIITS
jgi:hypothetical protein